MTGFCRLTLWNTILVLGTLLALGLAHGCERDAIRRAPAGRGEAIELANKELARQGYPVSEMVIEADESNRKWQTYLRSTPDFASHHSSEMAKLEGKKYWAVYLAPAPVANTLQGGGDAFVFVDAETRATLSVIRFK